MFTDIRLDHVVLRARDAALLVKFYCDVLGASVERELDLGLIQLRAGSIIIDIVPATSELGKKGGAAPRDAPNLDHFCVRVDPFDEAAIRAHLKACGAHGSPLRELYGADGFGPSIYVDDPEGNTLELKGPPVRGPISA